MASHVYRHPTSHDETYQHQPTEADGDVERATTSSENSTITEQDGSISRASVLKAVWSGSWFGVMGRASKQGVINEWTNFAIIAGLSGGIGATGLFAELPSKGVPQPLHTAFVAIWCAATLGMLTATLGFAVMIVGVTETKTEVEFRSWTHNMGSVARIPLTMLMFAGACFYAGVVVFFLIKCGLYSSLVCITVCAIVIFVPAVVNIFFIVRSTLLARSEDEGKLASYSCDADAMYTALHDYYLEDCQGQLGKMTHRGFVEHCSAHGETACKLATKIYERFLDEKIEGMLRSDPGF